MPTQSVARMMRWLTSAYAEEFDQDGNETVVARFLGLFVDGYWQTVDADITLALQQAHLPGMAGGVIDRWAEVVGVSRAPGESDAAYKVRIQGAIQRLYGGTRPDQIIAFVERVMGLSPGQVELIENDDGTGLYDNATFTVRFDPTAGTLGGSLTETELNDAIDALQDVLQLIAPAGVTGIIETTSGAMWDVDEWDEGLWGGSTTV